MKSSKSQIQAKYYKIPVIRFEDQRLTSFSGLLIFQVLFGRINLKKRLKTCFNHLKVSLIFGRSGCVASYCSSTVMLPPLTSMVKGCPGNVELQINEVFDQQGQDHAACAKQQHPKGFILFYPKICFLLR